MDLKRRKSNYRIPDRKHDFGSLLNRIITDNNQFALRESLNPLADENIFYLVGQEKHLSNQSLTSFLRLIERQVLIIGIILPKKTLMSCCQLLNNSKDGNFCSGNINCVILNKNMLAHTNTILLMMDENDITTDRKPDILQKIILNLSFVLVTSNQLLEKRISYWQAEDLLLDKNGGLMLIKQQGMYLHDQVSQRIQQLYWNFDSIFTHQLQYRNRGARKESNLLMPPQRYAYHQMNQEEDTQNGLKSKLNILCQMSLKKNWKISKGIMCYPFLYLLNIWLSDDPRDPRKLVQSSLVNYCKSVEEEFIKFLQNFKLPLDQLKFRHSIESQKNTMLFVAKKHLTMLQNIFPNLQLAEKSLQELQKFFGDKAREIYQINNSLASKMNATLLEKLYDEIINSKFETEETRTIQQLQSDFRTLLDVYGSQSFRVSSQLKTFNEFLTQRKIQYAQNLSKELQVGKKKYSSQKEQLKDRLQIQTGALETLQTELRELEEKRKKIDLENNLLKTSISELSNKKKIDLVSEYNSVSRKKFIDQKENKISKFEIRKEATKKQNKCCCLIM